MILGQLILEILAICVGLVLLWEFFVATVGLISIIVLLFIYFPIRIILDRSIKIAWGKVREDLP